MGKSQLGGILKQLRAREKLALTIWSWKKYKPYDVRKLEIEGGQFRGEGSTIISENLFCQREKSFIADCE